MNSIKLKNIKNFIALHKRISLYLLIFIPLVIVFMSELIQRGTLLNTITWIITYKTAFGLEYMLVFFSFSLFCLVLNRLNYSFLIITIPVIILSVANHYKLMILEEPLYPWDILLQGELFNIIGKLNLRLEFRILSIILILGFIYVIIRKKGRAIKYIRNRIILLICASSLLVGSIIFLYLNNENLSKLNVLCTYYDQNSNYTNNGFILAFVNNVGNIIIDKPRGYSEEYVKKIISKNNPYKNTTSSRVTKPNIIMVMNEAFWDPTLLPGVSFSEDPLTTVHNLQKSGNAGWLISPQFGGGTSNVEFEILTGFTMDFLPTDTIAYQQYIKNSFESVVSILNNNGYNSIALHPYDENFYNRSNVYRYFGFNEFISQNSFSKNDYKGEYISDKSAAKKIIDIYEKNLSTKKPLYNFTITMQNHYDYFKGKYPNNDSIKVSRNMLSNKDKEIIEAYSIGAKDSDQMLKTLIDYFSNKEDPTVIVFFGDHLPSLGGYTVYESTGYVLDGTKEENIKKLHETPLVIWNNYNKSITIPDYVNSNYLSPFLLSKLGLETSSFFKYLNSLQSILPAYRQGINIIGKNNNLSTEQQELWKEYQILQYDYLFGEKYGKNFYNN